ncbi:MAG: dihydropteroate synthase [Gammaproteobacteria bacterium]
MGILNVTPDSFSDGGCFQQRDIALQHALQMLREGADIIDIGGESTRPHAEPVAVQAELDRVIPVIEALRQESDVLISIDTSKAQVMREAVHAGANIINDVAALRGEGALTAAAGLEVPICLMHMQGEPRTMQRAPQYADVVAEVKTFLQARIDACVQAGISKERLWLDPGFGFGKTTQHNVRLLQHLAEFKALGLPLLVGLSRKSMIADLLDGAPVATRLPASLALALLAAQAGAHIIRVHDVKATADVLAMWRAVKLPE